MNARSFWIFVNRRRSISYLIDLLSGFGKYFCCGMRQWEDEVEARRFQEAIPTAKDWLLEVWNMEFFRAWWPQPGEFAAKYAPDAPDVD